MAAIPLPGLMSALPVLGLPVSPVFRSVSGPRLSVRFDRFSAWPGLILLAWTLCFWDY
jgi:hypothetical protein